MLVAIKIFYYEVFGKGSIKFNLDNEAVVKDALNELDILYGARFKEKTGIDFKEALKKPFHVFLNGKFIDIPSDLNRKLKDNDELTILRPVGGG